MDVDRRVVFTMALVLGALLLRLSRGENLVLGCVGLALVLGGLVAALVLPYADL